MFLRNQFWDNFWTDTNGINHRKRIREIEENDKENQIKIKGNLLFLIEIDTKYDKVRFL